MSQRALSTDARPVLASAGANEAGSSGSGESVTEDELAQDSGLPQETVAAILEDLGADSSSNDGSGVSMKSSRKRAAAQDGVGAVNQRFVGLGGRQQSGAFAQWQANIRRQAEAEKERRRREVLQALKPSEPTFRQADVDRALQQGKDEGQRLGFTQGEQQGRKAGYAEGEAAGRAAANQEIHAQMNQVLARLAQSLGQIEQRQQAMSARISGASSALAVRVVDHFWPTLDREAMESRLRDMMNLLARDILPEGSIRVWVRPEMEEAAQPLLAQAASDSGYSGEVRVLTDDALSMGDVRFEWSGGVLERNTAHLAEHLRAMVVAAVANPEAALLLSSSLPDGESDSESDGAKEAVPGG